jgi:hypothetical protein
VIAEEEAREKSDDSGGGVSGPGGLGLMGYGGLGSL